MKHNLEHFSEFMDNWHSQIPEEMRTDDKFLRLASHKGEDVTSGSVQNLVIAYARGNAPSELVGDDNKYCSMIIELYSNDYLKTVNDAKYGTGRRTKPGQEPRFKTLCESSLHRQCAYRPFHHAQQHCFCTTISALESISSRMISSTQGT